MKCIVSLLFLTFSIHGFYAQSACFSSANDITFQGPTNGQAIEKGDFDNDGKLDVIITNYTVGAANKLNFIKGNGNGTFQAPSIFSAGTRPISLKAADFNADGNLDIVVVNFNPANLSIVMGNGDGTFQAAVNYTPSAGPNDVEVGDFNEDSFLDLVVTASSGFNLFLGSSVTPGTFGTPTFFTMSTGARALVAGDFNNDTHLDVATANQSTANVSIRFGTGAAGFSAVTDYATGAGCFSIVTGDFNNDNLLDIATGNETADNLSVLINSGAGVFATAVNHATGDGPNGITTNDVNGDGFKDILVVNYLESTLFTYFGVGNGTFSAPAETASVGTPRDLVTGLFNSDGFQDVVVSTFVGQYMPVYLGNSTGSFTAGISVKTGNNPKSLHSNDFNSDGKKDVIVANSADNTFSLYNGAGNGQFAFSGSFATGTLPVSVYSADVNGDGFFDVVTANSSTNNVSVFLGNGAGSFSAASQFSANASPIFVRIGLLNADAFPDLAIINTANQLSVLFGTGTGSFGAPTAYATGTTPLSLVIKDLNGDGFNDLAVTNNGANSIGVFINSGSGTFAAPVNYTVGTTPNSIDAADIDNDTDMDLVVGNFGTNNFSRLSNNGSGVFTTAVNYSSSDSGTKGIVLTDYNNDGFQDVMALYNNTAGTTGIAALSLGNGSGVFTFYKRFAVGTTPLGIISLDANNDTRTDAAVINEINETFSVLLNTTAQITAGGPLSFCSGNSVLLTATAGSTYLWSNGATTPTVSATTSGAYSVTTTTGLSNWCNSTSNALTVSVSPGPPAPTITAGGPTTFCTGGSVTLTSSEATGNTWSNGATTQSITVTTSGNYTVTYSSAGCTSVPSNTISVVVNGTLPTITASGPTTFCTGGSVILTSSEPSNNVWSNGAVTPSITVNTAGSYTVTTTVGGCPSLTSIPTVVSIGSSIPTPTISTSGPTTFCTGGSVVLTSSSATDNIWSTGQTTQSITVSTSGNYSVTVNNGFCSASSSPIGITVNSLPSVPTITASGATTFCSGGSVILTSSSATNNVWSNGATTQSITVSTSGTFTVEVITNGCSSGNSIAETVTVNPIPATPTISASGPTTFCAGNSVVLTSSSATDNLWSTGETTQSITVTTSGSYSVIVDNSLCSATSAATSVTVNSLPTIPTITAGGATTFCSGGSVVLTSSSATDNLWSNGATTQSITVSSSGTYTVEVITNGCSSGNSIAETVTVNPTPATPTISASGPTTFCAGNSVVLTSSSATDNLWSTGETTQSITVTTSGSYSVIVDNGLCSATSAATSVTVNPLPTVPTITAGGATTFCAGNSVVLTSSSATDNLWSNGATTQSITVSNSGTFTVEVISNGCSSGNSIAETVTVNPIPATPTISASGPTTFCAGSSVVLTSSSATDNLWSTGETTQSITVTTSGSYSVIVDNGLCSATSAATSVTVNPLPTVPTITAGGATTFCSGGSVILTSSSTTNNVWSNGATTQSITVSTSGTFTVEVITNGCSSGNSIAETVTVNPIPATPTISASGPTTFCAGSSVVLTSSSATDNLWSTGETTQSITVTTSGSYSVIVDNSLCSATSAATNVIVNSLPTVPTITAGGATTFCSGGSVVLTSSSATDNLWSNGATTQSITVSTSGNFTVEVITNGCSSGNSIAQTVTVNPTPATPTISASGPTTFCAGNSVVLTSSSATDDNLWSTGETTQFITVTTSGSYSVIVDNGLCSATSAATSVTVNPLPTVPTITAGGATTFCSGGSVVLTSSSATDNLWSNGATTQSITVSTSGNFTVEVITNGCSSGNSIAETVTVNPTPATPTISASGPTTFCAGNSVVLTSSSATDNLWSTGETTQSITVTTSGSYSVIVDNSLCSATSAATSVTVNSLPTVPTITAGGATTFCSGGSVILTSSSATNNVWSNGATTQSITVSSSGTYTVEVITNGCSSGNSIAETVTVNPIPATPTISASGPTTFCAGNSVVLTSSSATDNLWSTGETTQSITVTTSGSYSVIVDNGLCSATSAATSVTVNPLPTVPTITAGGATTFCSGGSVILTSSSTTNNVWSNGATTQSITVSTSGTFTVEVITNGCSSGNSIAETVTVNPTPATPTISASGPTTFCAGNSVVLTSSSATDNLWSTGETTQSITVTISGSYSVIVDNGLCSATSAATSVTVNSLPTVPTITAGGATTFCSGGSVVLTSSSATDNLWSNGATTQSITVSTSGTFTVEVISNGCSSGNSIAETVTVNPIPATPTISASGPTTFCAGNSVVLTSSSATDNLWSTGETTQSITVTTSGSYSVIVDNGLCSATSAATSVTVNPLPTVPTITAGGATTFCAGNSVVLTSSSPTNNLWSNGATTQSITVTTSGTYTVALVNNGCSSGPSVGQPVTVNALPPTPTMLTGNTGTFCAGGSTVITASVSSGYLWSTGAITQSITVSSPGTYFVQAVNANGCQSASSASATISVIALPSAPTINPGGPTTFCTGGSIVLTSSSPINNVWSNGANTQSITVSTSGNYSVSYANANGCFSLSSQPVTVTVETAPSAPTISANGPLTFCSGGSVVLTSSNATGNTWSTGATTQSITVSTSGNYTVSYISVNGCASFLSAPTTVVVNANPSTPVITANGPTAFCNGGSVTLTSSALSGNSWSNGGLAVSITISSSGNYTVTYTNGNGCSATSAPSVVTVTTPITPVITSSGSTAICMGESVTLTSSIATGNVWSTGETSQSITASTAGNYSVVATQSGCPSSTSAAAVVTVNPLPEVPTITASGPLTFCDGESVFLFSSSPVNNTWSNGETNQVLSAETSGFYTVSTENTFGCSSTSVPVEVTVHALPVVELSPFEPVCDYTAEFTLTNGNPIDGVYSGTGVTGDIFDPATAGIGGTIITYAYTDTNGCANSDQEVLIVDDCAKLDELASNGFEVYPNPSSGQFTLSSESAVIHALLIYDAAGRLVFEESYDNPYSVELDLTNFANGVYQATILSEGTLYVRKQLVVNR